MVKKCQNCHDCQIVKLSNCPKWSKIAKIVINCQNFQKCQNCQQLSKCLSGHVSSWLWSNVSKVTGPPRVALWMSSSKVLSESVSESVSEWQGHLLSCSGRLTTIYEVCGGTLWWDISFKIYELPSIRETYCDARLHLHHLHCSLLSPLNI